MRRLALLGAFLLCLFANLRAQETKTPAAPGPIAESVARVARETWPIDFSPIDEQGRARFRTSVTETDPSIPPWQTHADQFHVPVRGALSHSELLSVITPEPFRSRVMYPAGVGVDPGEIVHNIKQAWRDWQARRIHARVTKELEEFLRATDDAGSK